MINRSHYQLLMLVMFMALHSLPSAAAPSYEETMRWVQSKMEAWTTDNTFYWDDEKDRRGEIVANWSLVSFEDSGICEIKCAFVEEQEWYRPDYLVSETRHEGLSRWTIDLRELREIEISQDGDSQCGLKFRFKNEPQVEMSWSVDHTYHPTSKNYKKTMSGRTFTLPSMGYNLRKTNRFRKGAYHALRPIPLVLDSKENADRLVKALLHARDLVRKKEIF